MFFALLLTVFAICGAAAGAYLGESRGLPPRLAAAGGGLLFGISLFWMLPEMAGQSGWLAAASALTLGGALLWSVDHFLYPICPSCSHTHDHHACQEPPLHGFGAPLLIAAGIHSLLDGWSVRVLAPEGVAGLAAPLGLALHKIPEGLALGLVARESISSGRRSFLLCVFAESLTLVGAFLEPFVDRAGALRFGGWWVTAVLAVTGGSFLFLGFHAVHGRRNEPGVLATFLLTLFGVAGIALVHWRFRMI